MVVHQERLCYQDHNTDFQIRKSKPRKAKNLHFYRAGVDANDAGTKTTV